MSSWGILLGWRVCLPVKIMFMSAVRNMITLELRHLYSWILFTTGNDLRVSKFLFFFSCETWSYISGQKENLRLLENILRFTNVKGLTCVHFLLIGCILIVISVDKWAPTCGMYGRTTWDVGGTTQGLVPFLHYATIWPCNIDVGAIALALRLCLHCTLRLRG
jgi:hypothetical protein